MDFIGYTSAIGGDDMFENCVENYGTYIMVECEAPKEGEAEKAEEKPADGEEEEEESKPFLDKESGKYYCENYVGDMSEEELGKFKNADGTYNFIYPDYDKDDNIIGMHKEENVTLYSSDLNYFFVNGLTGADHRNYTLVTDSIGRQSSAQYPTEDIVTRCAIMQYFNEDEMRLLNNMWKNVSTQVSSEGFSTTFKIIIGAAALLLLAVFVFIKKR